MAFNLYFAGVQSKEAEQRLEDNENLRLLSYFNDKKNIQRRVDKKLVTFIDSGAFSAHTRGIEPDVEDYIRYLNELDPYVSIAAQLDKIPGEFGKPKTRQQLEEAPILSWENYLYMYPKLKSPEKLLPIFHQGEDFKYLHQMLEHEPKVQYMGISPANDLPTSAKERWIGEVFKVIKKSSNPDIKTHAFGMTSLTVLERHPFYSADSTTWIMTGANGGIVTSYGTLLVSAKQAHNKQHIDHLPKAELEKLKQHVEEKGFNLETLGTDYKQRMLWNIEFLTEWAKNYQYKPKTVNQRKLF